MTSGARYQRVTTYPVISLSACRAKPKSRIWTGDVNRRRVHLTHTEEAGVVNALIARNKDSLVVFVRVPWAHSLRWRRDFLVWGPAEEIQKIRLHEAKGKWNTGYCVTQWAGHEAAQETRFIIRRVNNVYRAHRVYLKTTYPVNYTSRVNVL